MGVHRSTYYRWKRQVERSGPGDARPRERRRPQMPNQLSVMVEQRIVAFCLGSSRARARGGSRRGSRGRNGAGWSSAPTGSTRRCVRHGLNTRAKRLALVAGYRAPYEPPREPAPEPHIDIDAAGRAGRHRLLLRRPAARHQGPGLADHRDRHLLLATPGPTSSSARPPGPTVEQTSALARRVAAELQAAGWQLERVLTDNGNEFGRRAFGARLPAGVAHTQIRSGRPQTNGHVERLHRTILEECWRPAFARFLQVRYTGLRPRPRPLPTRLQLRPRTPRTNHGRATPGRPRLRCPQDGAEMSRTCRHNSESVQPSGHRRKSGHSLRRRQNVSGLAAGATEMSRDPGGRSSAGRAPGCGPGGRGFESRRSPSVRPSVRPSGNRLQWTSSRSGGRRSVGQGVNRSANTMFRCGRVERGSWRGEGQR